jgi:hypothetical protein
VTLQERYEKWRSSPEGKIYADGRPIIFTVEEWDQFRELSEEKTKVEAEKSRGPQRTETGNRQAGKKARSTQRKRNIENSLTPRHWHTSLAVHGLKKDFDRFNTDLPYILEGATHAYGLTELRVGKKK